LKDTTAYTSHVFNAVARGDRSNFLTAISFQTNYNDRGRKISTTFGHFDKIPACDEQTDGQNCRVTIALNAKTL